MNEPSLDASRGNGMSLPFRARAKAFMRCLINGEIGECYSVELVPNFSVGEPIDSNSRYDVTAKFRIRDGEVIIKRNISAMTAGADASRALFSVEDKQGDLE